MELSPPKPMDQSKNVTVKTFHIWPGSVHEHIFLALGGARGPWHGHYVSEPVEAGQSVATSYIIKVKFSVSGTLHMWYRCSNLFRQFMLIFS